MSISYCVRPLRAFQNHQRLLLIAQSPTNTPITSDNACATFKWNHLIVFKQKDTHTHTSSTWDYYSQSCGAFSVTKVCIIYWSWHLSLSLSTARFGQSYRNGHFLSDKIFTHMFRHRHSTSTCMQLTKYSKSKLVFHVSRN